MTARLCMLPFSMGSNGWCRFVAYSRDQVSFPQLSDYYCLFLRIVFLSFSAFLVSVFVTFHSIHSSLSVILETKTLDNVFVTVHVSVQYQVIREKVYSAYYVLSDLQAQMRAVREIHSSTHHFYCHSLLFLPSPLFLFYAALVCV